MQTLSLAIADKKQLYQSYIPFVKGGGLFVATDEVITMGDQVTLDLDLLGANFSIVGNVVWKTPAGNVGGSHSAGVGVQIPDDQVNIRNEIETLLAGYAPDVDRFTF